jgi:molybdate-binding protein/DNA-binding XRE family transcriptional regulator
VQNKLADIRRDRGISVAALAQAIGVRRQTIYAIESGAYVPNTAIALRLARLLSVTVEDLFVCEEPAAALIAGPEPVEIIDNARELAPGEPVRLCTIGERRIAVPASPPIDFFPEMNGRIAVPDGRKGREAYVQVLQEIDGHDLLIAGCDPAASLLATSLHDAGVRLIPWMANSSTALHLLKRGHAHVAGCHVFDRKSADANLAFLQKSFADGEISVVNFATWEEGILVARGNPKDIRSIEHLARKDIRVANRESGSGTRRLFDDLIKRAGITSAQINGYASKFETHLAAAREVRDGRADCCLGVSSAARLLGLDFIPVATERYDFAISNAFWKSKPVQVLLDQLNRAALRHVLEAACGYDTSMTGKVIAS